MADDENIKKTQEFHTHTEERERERESKTSEMNVSYVLGIGIASVLFLSDEKTTALQVVAIMK